MFADWEYGEIRDERKAGGLCEKVYFPCVEPELPCCKATRSVEVCEHV